MKGLFKFAIGIGIGTALGALAYVVLTSEDEQGLVHDIKTLANEVIEAGQQAAESKRSELEKELGVKLG